MAIVELETFPQIILSENQGLVGNRRWALDANDDLHEFLKIVCASHFPGYPDAVPIQVQAGGFWEGVNMRPDPVGSGRTYETLGLLPQYGKLLIVAQYALHHMTNCWPDLIPKPWHQKGTTLTMRVRGAGQFLLISPAGMKPGTAGSILCTEGAEAPSASFGAAIVLPVTEYHLSCDRMTRAQVNKAFGGTGPLGKSRDWDDFQGSVNQYRFLGASSGTLLFDGYEITETHACDPDEPNRYCLTACLKQRIVTDHNGKVWQDAQGNPVGWNHDYVAQNGSKLYDWIYITIHKGKDCLPRYTPLNFQTMFSPTDETGKCGELPATQTALGDCDLCVSEPDWGAMASENASSLPPSTPSEEQSSTSYSPPGPSSSPSVSSSSEELPPCRD
jgi:hypothetical protein